MNLRTVIPRDQWEPSVFVGGGIGGGGFKDGDGGVGFGFKTGAGVLYRLNESFGADLVVAGMLSGGSEWTLEYVTIYVGLQYTIHNR